MLLELNRLFVASTVLYRLLSFFVSVVIRFSTSLLYWLFSISLLASSSLLFTIRHEVILIIIRVIIRGVFAHFLYSIISIVVVRI